VETRFAYFALLSFLAFYRDWRVLLTASVVATADQLIAHTSVLQSFDYAGWSLFELGVLAEFTRQCRKEMYAVGRRNSLLEWVNDQTAAQVQLHTSDLRAEIGERERAEAALRDSEVRYRLMFEKSPLPMWLFDPDTLQFLAVNNEALRKYGYSREEFLSMALVDIQKPGAHAALTLPSFEGDPMASSSPIVEHVSKDGSAIEVELTSHRIEWHGTPAQMVLANDVTARRRAEREKKSMEVQLRHAQKLESIGQLAAGIAHEINTPTQYIGDNVRFLGDSFLGLQTLLEKHDQLLCAAEAERFQEELTVTIRDQEEQSDAAYLLKEFPRAVEQTLEGVDRVTTIVRAMKEFSHPGTKQKSPANLNDAIRSTITVSRSEWKYVADLDLDLDPDLPLVPCLVGDFNQVILNLVVNAAHAIGDRNRGGGTKGRIVVRTRAVHAAWAEISVADTGSGIPEAVRPRIFDPFFTTKQVGKGTGQGLAIARSVVVDKHGGSIDFETEMGRGTTFVVRLPLAIAPMEPRVDEEELQEVL
jgi:PAS domain S-box-containing protein